jgi:serine/threonine protein kinase
LRECAPGLLKVSNLDETLRDSSVAKSRGTNTTWKYDYGPTLGRGGMAEVVRATQRGAGQFAVARALKLILPEFAQAPQFEEMFHAEARIAALLQHRNIVRVLDHDRDPMGRLYLAMEFVDGVDLQKLRQSGPLPHDVIIFVLCEVLEALDYIHHLPPTNPLASPEEIAARGGARGLVHRDVSHDNVLISWEHEVKLSDFGIAKLQMGTWAQGSVQIKGKPRYMSPELASGAEKLDGRSDLWAVGVMLWELLTGHTLFDCESHMATLHAVMWAAITPPSAMVPGVQPQLEAVVMRLLEREITRRFQTAHEVIAALQSCHGASRDGRAALAQLLAQRFPDRARPIAASSPAIQSSDARLSQPPALSQPAHAGAAGDRPRSPSAGGPSAFAVPLAEGAAPLWQAASTTGHALGQAVPMPARLTRRWPWFAMLGAVVAAGGWTLVHQAARARATDAAPVILPAATAESPARPPAPAAPAPPVPASPVSPAAPVAASPAPAQITATISSKPPGATIRVEGLSPPIVGRSPVTVVAAPGTQLRVVAELPGFQSAVQTSMINGEHHDILVTLEPASAEKTISRPAPSAVPKPKAARPAKLPDDPGIIE